jgi:cytochrome c oxidase accessory protein FixG
VIDMQAQAQTSAATRGKVIASQLVETTSMYVSAAKIYPREIEGRYQRLRVIAAWVLMALFYLMPWLNLGSEQALLFDLPKRQFHVLGLNFWPQDFIFLAGILLVLAFSLFFFTALAGRLWCGYACPQTVWTEVFLALERITEGNRLQRIKLDRAPWSWDKLRRKTLKQLSWIILAAWTGISFVGFFSPIRELVPNLLRLNAGGWELFWIGFYGFATYGNAGYLREQVCKYMCPYARFQSAMFDNDTLIISYDTSRGEPRGPGKNRRVALAADKANHGSSEALGDCIDCTMCVQVCPTGIDIRDGLQIDCIACGTCIDACDRVMAKVGSPLGLIRYSTENAIAGRPSRMMRPRIIIYGALLLTILTALALGLIARKPLLVDVLRDRNALYRTLGDGTIENSYTLKITNKSADARRFVITLIAPEAIRLLGRSDAGSLSVRVAARATQAVPVTVHGDASNLGAHTRIRFAVHDRAAPETARTEESWFFAPEEHSDEH